MIDFPTLSHTSTNEIPALSYTQRLKKAPLSGGTSLRRPLEGVSPPRGSTRAHRCLYFTLSWSFQHFLSFQITFYQISHWTSFSFKMFLSDESIHGKPDTLDTFALWNPRQSCILDSMPCIPDSRYCSPDFNPKRYSGFPELHSRIQSPGILDSTAKFPGFRNQSTSENFPESGIMIPLHGANTSPGLPAEWSMQSDSTSGEPDRKQVAVISKEYSRFRFPFQNKRTPFHIMFRL